MSSLLRVQTERPLNTGKRHTYLHLVDRIFGVPLMMHRGRLEAIMEYLGPRLLADVIPPADDFDMDEPGDETAYGEGVVTIPVHGSLVKRAGSMNPMSGSLTSYSGIQQMVSAAMADPSCTALLFDFDTPGGESAGMFDLANYLYSLRGAKPMYGVANDSAYSAGYALASCMDKLFITPVAGVGSVGCYMLHVNRSSADKMNGLEYTYISAGDKKVDGNPHEKLSAGARADLQDEVDRQRDMFVTLVARNRSVTAQSVLDTQAGCFQAFGNNCAIPMLADAIGGMDDAADELCNLIGAKRMPARGRSVASGFMDQATRYSFRSDITLVEHADMELIIAGAIGPHTTATSTGAWDGPANEGRLKADQPAGYYRKEYAWVDSAKDATTKAAYKFPHHEVSGAGDIGAANVKACQSIIGSLNGARGGSSIPSADRKGVYAHAAHHLRDAKVEPAPLKSESEALSAAIASLHELDADPFATIARLRLGSDPKRLIAGTYSYEGSGSDIEIALRSFKTLATLTSVKVDTNGACVGRTIRCLLAPYGQLSEDLGGFREVYEPGCFSEALADRGDDPRAFYNHNPDYVLGRKSAGTARFFEQADGLYLEADPPDTQWANDLIVSMRRGDINQASAAFYILRPRWEFRSSQRIRVIEKAKLVEGSVASLAAYDSTTAHLEQPPSETAVAAQQEHLAARLRLLSRK